jgi:4-aminobutyrate aminotransferase-like enzyme
MSETYQGCNATIMPPEYARKLREWCDRHKAVMIFDEVQAGFGRSGKMFTYEHYDVKPDLIACGKGISSSLPISAVIGRKDIMDIYAPGSMTSTHSASPLCVAAALANLELIQREKLVANSAAMGAILLAELARIQKKYAAKGLGCLQGRGLVAGIQCVNPGTTEPDRALAVKINTACFQKGLLMFAPVGIAGECLKISPPLSITEDMLRESVAVFEEAIREVLG